MQIKAKRIAKEEKEFLGKSSYNHQTRSPNAFNVKENGAHEKWRKRLIDGSLTIDNMPRHVSKT